MQKRTTLALNEDLSVQEILNAYEGACYNIANKFVEIYYNTYPEFTDESYWIADDVGGVLEINDDFWGIDDMRTALKLNIPEKILFEWYNTYLQAGIESADTHPNLRYFYLTQK